MSLGDLLTLRAFRPNVKNAELPLAKRLPGQRVLVLGVGAEQIKATVLAVPPSDSTPPVIEHCEVFVRRHPRPLAEIIRSIRERDPYQKARYAVVALEHGWKLELVRGYFAAESLNLQLRRNPAEVVDVEGAADFAFAGLAHPLGDQMLLFSAPLSEVGQVHQAIEEAGLPVVRFKIAALSAVEVLFHRHPERAHGDLLYVDRNSYCLIQHVPNPSGAEGVESWSSVRFSSRRPGEALEQMASALRTRENPAARVTLLAEAGLLDEVRRLEPSLSFEVPFEQHHFDLFSTCVR